VQFPGTFERPARSAIPSSKTSYPVSHPSSSRRPSFIPESACGFAVTRQGRLVAVLLKTLGVDVGVLGGVLRDRNYPKRRE